MAFLPEPDIIMQKSKPEEIFQTALTEEIKMIMEKKKKENEVLDYFMLKGYGLDIAVFVKRNNGSNIYFIEVKAFVGSRPNGVGFGNQKGEGSQIDLLLLEDNLLSLANDFARWVLVDGTKSKGQNRYVFFDCKEAKKVTMNGVRRGKQNNFNVNVLMREAINWYDLSMQIDSFLSS